LEESINRREFRTPPNMPLHTRTPKTEVEIRRRRKERLEATIQMVRERRGSFLAKMVNDVVVDMTLADYWNKHLDALYRETRLFNYDGAWPTPILLHHTGDGRELQTLPPEEE
jgi:hypothetical protein